MGTENLGPPNIRVYAPENEAEPQHKAEPAKREEQAPPNAPALVAQMAAAGRWPAPQLLEQILNAGDAAVEPLLAILRTNPRRWPAKASLVHAARLLSEFRPPTAIPEFVSIIRRYIDKPEEQAADAIARYGAPGFEILLDLCRDPSICGYRRVDVAFAARIAAGDDPVLKARLADVLRPILEQLMAKAREEPKQKGPLGPTDGDEDHPGARSDVLVDEDAEDAIDEDLLDEEEEFDDDLDEDEVLEDDDDWFEDEDLEEIEDLGEDEDLEEDEYELVQDVREELTYYASDLAELADPLAVDLIETAFEEDAIDDTYLDREEVDELYRSGGFTPEAKTDWLETYRNSYDRHIEELNPPVVPPPINEPRPKYRYEDRYDEGEPPAGIPVTAPILNTGPRLGRNDPCWCGSGKKYKKCHLGKEALR